MPFAILGAAIAGAIGAATTAVSVGIFGGTFLGIGAANLWGAIGAAFAVSFAGDATGGSAQGALDP
jgi:hypothetical protein